MASEKMQCCGTEALDGGISCDVTPETVEREIKKVLACSVDAWNAGNLARFLDCYENSPHTSYLTSDQIVIGYAEIMRLYSERFSLFSVASRGTLSMSLARVVRLGAEHSLALGRYRLSRDDLNGGSADGVFSLVLRKTSLGWRIAADHTSA
jgi:ketosteroid isomerase-like protein